MGFLKPTHFDEKVKKKSNKLLVCFRMNLMTGMDI